MVVSSAKTKKFVMYMHIDGRGDAVKLATAIHAALARSGTPMGPAPAAAVPAATPVESPQAVEPTQFLKSIEEIGRAHV